MHYNKLSEILRAKNTEKVVKYCGEKNTCFQYTKKKRRISSYGDLGTCLRIYQGG